MKFIHSLLGMTAQTNAQWSRESVNFVPFNIAMILICFIVGACSAGMALWENQPLAILVAIPCALGFGLLVTSTIKRDTFFLRDKTPASTPIGSTSEEVAFGIPLAFTGKLRLDEKTERRFLNVPVATTRLGDGELAFASRIDASTRMYSIVTKSRVGVWLSLPALQNVSMENGTLLHGKTPAPALRVQYEEKSGAKPKRVTTILSFGSTETRDAMRAFLQAQSGSNSPFSNA